MLSSGEVSLSSAASWERSDRMQIVTARIVNST